MGSKYSFVNHPSKLLPALTVSFLMSYSALHAGTTSHEAFFLKRIAEYHKEGDCSTTKNQIENFLEKYPESKAKESLYPLLASLYLQEKNYTKAYDTLQKISSEDLLRKISYQKTVCLYELGKDDELIDYSSKILASPLQPEEPETIRYFLATTLLKKASTCKNDLKNDFYKQALSHFSSLENSKYAEQALQHAAELAREIGDREKACQLYKVLLEKNPCNREEILYKIASIQEKIKPLEAVKTFGQVYKLRGTRAADAAFKQLQILFHNEKYKELLLYQEEAKRHISSDKKAWMHYFAGKSLLHLEDFAGAKRHLAAALDEGIFDENEQKTIIKHLTLCSSKTKDSSLLQTLITRWQELSPSDPDIADAYILCYQLLQNKSPQSAANILTQVLEKYPDHKEGEALLYNLALIEAKLQQWSLASDHYKTLLEKFPNGKNAALALRSLVKTKMEEVRLASEDTLVIKQDELTHLLEDALRTKHIFSEEEKNKITFSYAQLLVESKKYEKGLDVLLEYLDSGPDHKTLSEAYLLTAKCYSALSENTALFISFAEKALDASSADVNAQALHLSLYNAYLDLADHAQDSEKNDLIRKGASHLLSAYKQGANLKEENLHWLSQLLYSDAKLENKGSSEAAYMIGNISDATALYQHVLGIHHYPPKIDFSKIPLSNEAEILRLADLLGWQGKLAEKIDTLEVLVHAQKTLPEKAWKLQRKAQLELARSYKESGNIELSIDTFDDIISSAQYAPSFIANEARLEKAKLEIIQLKEQNTAHDDPRWQKVLDTLKDLELAKRIYSEPLHLEAALTYVECKTQGLNICERAEKALALLEKTKQNFSDKNDKETAAYLEGLSKYPNGAKTYAHYMKLIDSLILMKKAEIAQIAKSDASAKAFKEKSMLSLSEISQSQELPSALKDRIIQSMEGADRPL